MKHYFCPNCRRNIPLPKFLKSNINFQGTCIINCGNCNPDGKGNPLGKIKIKPTNLPKAEPIENLEEIKPIAEEQKEN